MVGGTSTEQRDSPLGRLLFYRDDDGVVSSQGHRTAVGRSSAVAVRVSCRKPPEVASASRAPTGIEGRHAEAGRDAPSGLEAAVFDRVFDERWRRTSYSAGSRPDAHDARVGSEPEEVLDHRRGGPARLESIAGWAVRGVRSFDSVPLQLVAICPAGSMSASFVHGVLEIDDFAAADLDEDLRCRIEAEMRGARSRWAIATFSSPDCGPPSSPRSAISSTASSSAPVRTRADRLDEVGFELPLAGGEDPCGTSRCHDVAELLRTQPRR